MNIDLCVATYLRPEGLTELVRSLEQADRDGHRLRLVIVDNDAAGSARTTVDELFVGSEIDHVYAVEAEPGIPAARNRALDLVDRTADALIFVDDDEILTPGWLRELTAAAVRWDADIVVGPVVSILPEDAPSWMHRGEFFQRKRFPSGPYAGLAATNNVLVRTAFLDRAGWPRFDPRFTASGGEDTDLFHRLKAFAPVVVWADDAEVHEPIPPERAGVRWLWHRYLRSGNISGQVTGRSRPALAVDGVLRIGHGTLLALRSLVTQRVVHVRAVESMGRGCGALLASVGVEVTEYHRPAVVEPSTTPRPERSAELVSVVIPTYNAADTLRAQLVALSRQNHPGRFEVVVADNGSTDGLAARFPALTEGLDLDLRLVDAAGCRGVSHARNVGVAASTGGLVLICDADDEVHPSWMSDLVAEAAEADLVGGSMAVDQLNPGPERQWRPLPRAGTLPGKLNFLPFARGCNIAVWRDVLDTVGGWDESLVAGGDDVDFSWRVQLAGYRMVAAERALVQYRLRPDMSGMAKQVYRYSRTDAALLRRYRADGARAAGVSRLVRDIGWMVVALPKVRDIVWRGKIVARGSQLAGRIAGSVRHRVWAL